MKDIHSIKLKLQYEPKIAKDEAAGCNTAHQVIDKIIEMTETLDLDIIYVHPQVSMDEISSMLKNTHLTIRETSDTVMEGCYGARTGKQLPGMEVWIDASDFAERGHYSDLDGNKYEVFNPIAVLYNCEQLNIDLNDEDTAIGLLGEPTSRNNSYNYAGDTDTPSFLSDIDYSYWERDNDTILVVKFHCGGDIRGNYTDLFTFKFECIDDMFQVIYPIEYGEDE